MKKLFAIFVVLGLVAGPAFFALRWADEYLAAIQKPLPLAEPDTSILEVKAGQSLGGLLEDLAERGGPAPPPAIVLRAFLHWQPHWAEIKSGFFALGSSDSVLSVLEKVQRGDVASFSLTVVEGVRAAEFIHLAREKPGVVDDLPSDLASLATALDIEPLEGSFLPETYRVDWGSPLSGVLKHAHHAMQKARDSAWALCKKPDCAINSPDELMVLASIIEKETGLGSERTEISGVFHRRLKRGMRLQTDPTVIYGLGEEFDGNLTRAHLRTDTPWNTYTRNGLPPTPICLPGMASIQAAAKPGDGDSLYFVARGDGSHAFSSTLEEHNRAVRKYQLRGRK